MCGLKRSKGVASGEEEQTVCPAVMQHICRTDIRRKHERVRPRNSLLHWTLWSTAVGTWRALNARARNPRRARDAREGRRVATRTQK